jgi:hypothetical protein
MRLTGLGQIALLLSCGDALTEPSELVLGTADLRVSGSLTTNGDPTDFPEQLAGTACERLGWLNIYSVPPTAVAVFRSGAAGFGVGEVPMTQPDLVLEPGGHVNGVGRRGSLSAIAGTTTFTLVTADELRGRIDWTLAYPENPEDGSLRLRGTFRSLRTGDECMPSSPALAERMTGPPGTRELLASWLAPPR